MTYGMWLSTAGLQVNQYRQDIMANNLANANTVGFKRDLAVFHERALESRASAHNRRFAHPVLDGLTGGIFVKPTVHTFEPGDFEKTGNPFDVALDGDGFLAVSDGTETRYTRDGRMARNAQGELVLVAGQGRFRVLDDAGTPIRLSDAGGAITVSGNGTVHQGDETVGRIGAVQFADKSQLSKVGMNLYANRGAPPTASNAAFRNGFVEQSTADPIKGLAQMIEVARAYQLNANLISLQDHTIGQAVTAVGRIR